MDHTSRNMSLFCCVYYQSVFIATLGQIHCLWDAMIDSDSLLPFLTPWGIPVFGSPQTELFHETLIGGSQWTLAAATAGVPGTPLPQYTHPEAAAACIGSRLFSSVTGFSLWLYPSRYFTTRGRETGYSLAQGTGG